MLPGWCTIERACYVVRVLLTHRSWRQHLSMEAHRSPRAVPAPSQPPAEAGMLPSCEGRGGRGVGRRVSRLGPKNFDIIGPTADIWDAAEKLTAAAAGRSPNVVTNGTATLSSAPGASGPAPTWVLFAWMLRCLCASRSRALRLVDHVRRWQATLPSYCFGVRRSIHPTLPPRAGLH